jgi:hypothetical protein
MLMPLHFTIAFATPFFDAAVSACGGGVIREVWQQYVRAAVRAKMSQRCA